MALQFYDTFDNSSRGFIGAGGQLNIYDPTLNKYKLFIPVETLPSVTGSVNSVENDVTTSATVGQIQGKKTLENKDVTFLWNRDDLARLMEHNNETNKYLVSYADGTGYFFTASYSIKPDDVASGDKATGTVTFIPSETDDEPTLDVSNFLVRSCIITSQIKSDTLLSSANKVATYKLENAIGDVTYTPTSTNSAFTPAISGNTLTITANSNVETGATGIIKVVAKKSGYAEWFVTTRAIYE